MSCETTETPDIPELKLEYTTSNRGGKMIKTSDNYFFNLNRTSSNGAVSFMLCSS